MHLTPTEMAARLDESARAIDALARGLDARLAYWKPAPDQWSILEIVNHVADEEAEDFRRRLQLVLSDPVASWPPIDPPGWVVARRYAERALDESLDRFRAERAASLAWLRALPSADWTATHPHPAMGPMTAGTIAASWLAHDLLHVRQIARRRYEFVAATAAPHPIAYAGTW